MMLGESPRRGPALGGVCLGKPTDSSETAGRARFPAWQSVRCVPVMARSLEHIKAVGTSQERLESRIAQTLQVCTTADHGDVDRTPMMRWTDSSPLANDLMTPGIRLCSYVIGVDSVRSHTIIIALQCMHHAPSD